jgi:hypothetical protein
VLDGLVSQAEVGGRRQHVAVIGSHRALSDLVCRRKMNFVGGAYEEIAGSGNHQCTGPPEQSFANGNEVPQSVIYVLECGDVVRHETRPRPIATIGWYLLFGQAREPVETQVH